MKISSAAHNLSFSPSRNARDLRAGNDDGDFSDTGDAAICGEREPYVKSPEDLRFASEVERVERDAALLPIEIAANVIMNQCQSMCQCHLHLP